MSPTTTTLALLTAASEILHEMRTLGLVLLSCFLLVVLKTSATETDPKVAVKPAALEEDLFFRIIEPEVLSYFYRVRTAKDFGSRFNASLRHVPLVLIDPPHACSHGINNAYSIMDNIALIIRGGGCSFLTKTLNAEDAGAMAVIIADNDEEDPSGVLVDMVHDGTERTASIPAAYMLGKSGQMIRLKLKELGRDRAIIDIPVNSSSVPYNIHVHQPPWSIW